MITFETDHSGGWPPVLARLSGASGAELAHCVERAWPVRAPKKLKAEHANARPARPQSSKNKKKRRTQYPLRRSFFAALRAA